MSDVLDIEGLVKLCKTVHLDVELGKAMEEPAIDECPLIRTFRMVGLRTCGMGVDFGRTFWRNH